MLQLTGHVHHATVAVFHQVARLAVRAAGADAVGFEVIRARRGGFTAPPRSREIHQLNKNSLCSNKTRSKEPLKISSTLTRCSWHDTNVWNPGATPKPSWSINGGSSWLWIWTLIPASNDESSRRERERDKTFYRAHDVCLGCLFSLVSPHTGKYSSCWMSSMISSPFPIPPLTLIFGESLSPELNV